MKLNRHLKAVFWLAAVSLLLGSFPALAEDAVNLQVYPDVVEIGAFFNGRTVEVSATIPAEAEAVMELVGPSTVEHLMRKGRRGGLWLNVGEIKVENAPSLYLVMSTKPQLLTAAPPEAAWGLTSLKKRIQFSGRIEAGEREQFLGQFLKLKESENIYGAYPGAIQVTLAASGSKKVKGSFAIPTNVKPGTYEVWLSVIQQGAVAEQPRANLKVEMTGFPAMLFTMAYEHGATYGILAVVIAIITGFAMGFLFKGGGGH